MNRHSFIANNCARFCLTLAQRYSEIDDLCRDFFEGARELIGFNSLTVDELKG